MSRPEALRRRAGREPQAAQAVVLIAGFALALAALSYGIEREANDPRFAVRVIAVRGVVQTQPGDVVRAASLARGQNAWLINRRAVARRIEALPWIGRATLAVAWPNKLAITVVERTPVARVVLAPAAEEAAAPRLAVIDQTQRVLALDDGTAGNESLPKLVVQPVPADVAAGVPLANKDVAQALAALSQLRSLGLRVSEVAIAPSTGISATADRNFRVLFGEDQDLAKKAALFQAIVAKISTPGRIAYVDVRSVRAPTVLYR